MKDKSNCALFILVFIGFILVPIFAHSQDIGDSVMLKESRSGRGIPAHAKPLIKEITFSFQNNSIVTIRKIHLEKMKYLMRDIHFLLLLGSPLSKIIFFFDFL